MKKIGIIKHVNPSIHEILEVIEIEGRCYAGKDAFSYPHYQHNILHIESTSIPSRYYWIEQYNECLMQNTEPKKDPIKKYQVIHGIDALHIIEDILKRHETGCLAINDRNAPYIIPMNQVYFEGRLYMHCGRKGKKLSLIRNNANASYIIYGPTEPILDKMLICHTSFESVCLKGKIRISNDIKEIELGVRKMCEKYSVPYEQEHMDNIHILVYDINYMTARTGRFHPRYNKPLYYYNYLRKS